MCSKKKTESVYSPEFVKEKLRAIPRETTPRRITPPIKRLCKRLVPEATPGFVPVLAAPSAKPNAICENVDEVIRVNGGEHAPGWLIWEMRGVLLNAERYSCWRSPEGDLIDVSPKPDGEKRILFLQSPEPWDGSRVCPITFALNDDEPVKKYIKLYQSERRLWVKDVTDFKRQKELYLAMVEMSDHLAAQKKKGKR
jgi:hypothetical protein